MTYWHEVRFIEGLSRESVGIGAHWRYALRSYAHRGQGIEAFKLRQVCTLFCESAVYCLFCHVVTASNIQISRPLMEEITQFVGSSWMKQKCFILKLRWKRPAGSDLEYQGCCGPAVNAYNGIEIQCCITTSLLVEWLRIRPSTLRLVWISSFLYLITCSSNESTTPNSPVGGGDTRHSPIS